MKTCAIYAIRHRASGKLYIGQARDLSNRKSSHFAALRCNRHKNRHLQAAFNLHGPDAFDFIIMETLPSPDRLDERERFLIKANRSDNPDHGYNHESGGRRNHQVTLPTRARMTIAQQIRRNREYSI
jgi:group I intron endonuclease